MGDYIEGIDGPGGATGVVFYHANPPTYRRSHYAETYSSSSGRDKASRATLCLGLGLLCAGMSFGGAIGLFLWMASDAEKFAATVSGKCFETAVGAKGLVEAPVGSTRAQLIFPSGLRETYPISKLSEVPCALISDSANAQSEGND
jgi:hypothetical protein